MPGARKDELGGTYSQNQVHVLHVSPLLTHLLTVDECITTSIRIPT